MATSTIIFIVLGIILIGFLRRPVGWLLNFLIRNFIKGMMLLLIVVIILSQCASAQDFIDYSHSDPDNIVNSIDTTIPTLEESIEKLKESKKKFEYIYEIISNKPEYKAVEESNTVDGIKKDSNSFVEWFINTTFIKWLLGTETAKGIKEDINKDVEKEVKVTLENKNVD